MNLFSSRTRLLRGPIVVFLLALSAAPTAHALDGLGTVGLTPMAGWTALELVTRTDNVSAVVDAGYGTSLQLGTFDGLGLYRDGDQLSIWVNHETSNAAISRVDVDRDNLKQAIEFTRGTSGATLPASIVTGVGFAYDAIFDGTYHATTNPLPAASGSAAVKAYGNSFFDRFCSGTSYSANTFGLGHGFADSLYLTGEEVTNGAFYALDESTRTLWEVPDLGKGNWENAAAIDTGDTNHVALVLSSDIGSSPGDYLRLYVGEKGIDSNGDGQIDFLENNGLRGGQVYYFHPETGASLTDLPDGAVDGLWDTSTTGALRETKLEDVHTNPQDGGQLVFADQTDGVYRMDVDLNFTPGGTLDTAASAVNIWQIDDSSTAPVSAPDNLTWSDDNRLYIQEDGSGDGVFEMAPDGTGRVQIADAFTEPSGIFDVSQTLGYYPGSVLLSSLQGSASQLLALVSPDAELLLSGDYNWDGPVNAADHATWAAAYGSAAEWRADGNADGLADAADYTIWRDNLPIAAAAVPEPGAASLLLLAAFPWMTRRF